MLNKSDRLSNAFRPPKAARYAALSFLMWFSASATAALDVDSARFLTQATFGPRLNDIKRLASIGTEAWLTEQFAAQPGLLLPKAQSLYDQLRADCLRTARTNCPPDRASILDTSDDQWRLAWWNQAINGQDQLRQRVALALSEILVISDTSRSVRQSMFGTANYYDTLARNAFGNYRTLLEQVTLHPIMGLFLGMTNSPMSNPDINWSVDENYARELLQLFTVGLYELNLNGTPKLDTTGKPIAAYGQEQVEALARALTGWTFAGKPWNTHYSLASRIPPMQPNDLYHDKGEKRLLRGTVLSAGQSARDDLKSALDNVFNHPNVGPFIVRQLIQRLVTSNPSPAYVARVASVFNNNGQGVRGDLKAVVRAILMDSEARAGTAANFGKPREPLLRQTHLLRAFGAIPLISDREVGVATTASVFRSPVNGFGLRRIEMETGQNILRAPTVFNFFHPDYVPGGLLRDAKLVAPEFEIFTDYAASAFANRINSHTQVTASNGYLSYLNLAREANLTTDPDALLDHLNVVLMAGSLTSELRTIVKKHLTQSNFPDGAAGNLARARDAIALLANSPEYLIQK